MNFQPLIDFLDGYLPMLGVPGSDTVIYKNHEQIFRHTSGFDSLNMRTAVRQDSLYNVYSCTKVATAVAATQLIERGELLVTDPLYAYYPEFANMEVRVRDNSGNIIGTERARSVITIQHLLTMSSGIDYRITDSPSISRVIRETSGRAPTQDICRAIASEPLEFNPGTDYLYGLSYDVLGGVIEMVSGMPLSEYMKENIFDPIGMKDTAFHITPEMMARFAAQYRYDPETRTAIEIPATDCVYRMGTEFDGGGAGLVSSVNDQILFADALANRGVCKNGNRILSAFGVNLLSSNMLSPAQQKSFAVSHNVGYGYGYGVRTNLTPELFGNVAPKGEFGWDGAKMCFMSCAPDQGIAIFHAEHMGGTHRMTIPRLRNLAYSCIGE